MNRNKEFFKYVIPTIISFTLTGIYSIVDGFFVGNSIGDVGLSSINIAYPISALIQSFGIGIGMGGSVRYSIEKAEKNNDRAKSFIGGTMQLLTIASLLCTILLYLFSEPLLRLLGADGEVLAQSKSYIDVIALGSFFQIFSTAFIPIIRNLGGAYFATITMMLGFISNIIFDYIFIWQLNLGTFGAGLATVIGQAVALIVGLMYLIKKKGITFKTYKHNLLNIWKSILKIGIAPFGLNLSPNFSLILINRFSVFYGGEEAIASYACVSYVIVIVYLILQGVGDGSQPLISKYYGEGKAQNLKYIQKIALVFALFLSALGILALYLVRFEVGKLLGASDFVIQYTGKVFPIFLIAIPFIGINRIITAGFYASEKSIYSYILTYIEPVLMLFFLLVLPPFFGGQIMVWWSISLARILSAVLAVVLKKCDKSVVA